MAVGPGTLPTFFPVAGVRLGIGTAGISDGRQVKGFICEAEAVADGTDITQLGGWRNYRAQG